MNSILHKLQSNPLLFVNKFLGKEKPWIKQTEIMNSVLNYPKTTVRSGQGIGKTFIASLIFLWFILTHKNSVVITTAPSFRQVEEILWREIHRQYNNAQVPLGGKLLNTQL